jgi:hypothetical protein
VDPIGAGAGLAPPGRRHLPGAPVRATPPGHPALRTPQPPQLDPGAFSQNRDALQAKGDLDGAPVVGAATVQHPALMVTTGHPDGRDKQYDPVAPLTGPTGVSYASYNLSTLRPPS